MVKHTGTRKQRHTIAQRLVFWRQKCRRNFNGVTPSGRQIEVGQVQIDDIRPTSGYIPETVQDTDIVTMPTMEH